LNLEEEILSLKTRMGATILAHNYQIPPIQDLADFVGDSLELSIKATNVDNQTIVFCGVTFMAETAKILNPGKKVLIPRRDARCPMAEMATAEEIIEARKNHPDAAVVSYVNTNADVKAVSDVCCTSANAVKIVESIDEDEIIFVPDQHLANYVATQTEKTIIPWGGFCYVHARILASEVRDAKTLHPEAVLLVHPECPTEIIELADEVLSTGGMVRYARESDAREFLIGTEEGLLYRLAKENPGKRFMPAGTPRTCTSMKKITLSDTYESLARGRYEVDLPGEVMRRAERSLKRMIELS
jgi:quinolinate synthase